MRWPLVLTALLLFSVGCRLETGSACANNTECPNTQVCAESRCSLPCVGTRDCPYGTACTPVAALRVCRPSTATNACTSNADCLEGADCQPDHTCSQQCSASRPCPLGFTCSPAAHCIVAPITQPRDS